VLGAVGLVGAVGGAGLLWLDGEKDARGYVATNDNELSTPTRALVSENLDLDLVGVGADVGADALGKLRLDVASRDGKPLFVGVARTDDVDAYVHGSAHAVVRDLDFAPFDANVDDRAGGPLAPPATRDIWVASGAHALDWKVRDGDWSVVVMNADGSPGVDAELDAGLSLPWVDEAGWGLLGGGVIVLVGAAALVLVARQRRPDEPNPSAPRSVPSSSPTTVSSGAQ
jgi:hypothetical protein